MINPKKAHKREKKKIRIRKKISGTAARPRLTVYRSGNHGYAQIVDDTAGKTLVSVSTNGKDVRKEFEALKTPMEKYKHLGELAAKRAIENNITTVVFDRNGYLYHGRVKALADGAREAGLKF